MVIFPIVLASTLAFSTPCEMHTNNVKIDVVTESGVFGHDDNGYCYRFDGFMLGDVSGIPETYCFDGTYNQELDIYESIWSYSVAWNTSTLGNWDVLLCEKTEYIPENDETLLYIDTFVDGIHTFAISGNVENVDRVSVEKYGFPNDPEYWEIMEF